MVVFKVFILLWPFIKEMVLGDKSLMHALRNNKKKVLFILTIFMSIGLNFIVTYKLVELSKDYLALTNKYSQSLERDYLAAKDKMNGTHITPPPAGSGKVKSIVYDLGITEPKCVVPVLPAIPVTPPLPLNEISLLASNDTAGLAEIEKKHIIELRRQLEFVKKTLIMYRDDVNAICGKKY
jgi:hypothetical protein